jgi:hypothetical protein
MESLAELLLQAIHTLQANKGTPDGHLLLGAVQAEQEEAAQQLPKRKAQLAAMEAQQKQLQVCGQHNV